MNTSRRSPGAGGTQTGGFAGTANTGGGAGAGTGNPGGGEAGGSGVVILKVRFQ